MKRARRTNQTIPRWAYLLFVVLAAFVLYRIFQHRASEAKAAQPPVRPVLVAKVITKDVPLYLDEIGTCAAYETVQVQAQVSGQIVARSFQDGADVKKGDLLFTIDPRPYQAALEQAQAQAILQFGDAAGERRLGAPCGARGSPEPTMTCDPVEIG